MLRERILNTQLLPNQIALFYLGQKCFLLKYREKFFLFDAYLSDAVDRKHADWDRGWKRRFPAPIAAEALDFVDYIFCSHAHTDHMDPDTLRVLAHVNQKARYIVPAPLVDRLLACGVAQEHVIPAYADQPLQLGDTAVLPIPAAHEQLLPNEKGEYDALGYRLTCGEIILYHAGDCCVYEGLSERIGIVHVMLLPVNGRSFYKLQNNIIGNMDCFEAVQLAQLAHAELLIPMHHDLYPANGLSSAVFADAVENMNPAQAYHIFRPGERYIFSL